MNAHTTILAISAGGSVKWWKGTYCGKDVNLVGKTALLRSGASPDFVLAQFDDVETGLGQSWTCFPKTDFIEDTI